MPTPSNVGPGFSTTNDSVINCPTKSEGSELSSSEKVITKTEVSTIKRATSLKIKLNKEQQGRTGEREALRLEIFTKFDAVWRAFLYKTLFSILTKELKVLTRPPK